MPATEQKRDAAEKIVNPATKTAHDLLLQTMPSLGLTPSHNSGHVKAVRLHDVENRYLFSWIPSQAHLLFYVRKPALTAASRLLQSIRKTSLVSTRNPAGEITIRIEREAHARELIEWLTTELPLPNSPQ
jgi:hypothetical protein